MTRRTLLTVVGARPQFIKAAPVGRRLAERSGVRHVLVHTGQHHDWNMSERFFDELGLPRPDHELGIAGGSHGAMTGRMLAAIESVLVAERPAAVIVYGDTNSTLAAALAAAKLNLPVCHVEAGLRSFNRTMPEEINRVLTDHVASLSFCPTAAAVANLAAEGITEGVHHVGDVMYDCALAFGGHARETSTILDRLALPERSYRLATIHRAANTDDPARLAAILAYCRAGSDLPVVLPLHPRTRAAVVAHGLSLEGIRVLDPVGYLDMVRLLQGAAVVLTDSGGVQKEAYFHGVACVTLREDTEWVETIAAGWNRLWQGPDYLVPRRVIGDYGDGDAAGRIVELVIDRFG